MMSKWKHSGVLALRSCIVACGPDAAERARASGHGANLLASGQDPTLARYAIDVLTTARVRLPRIGTSQMGRRARTWRIGRIEEAFVIPGAGYCYRGMRRAR